MRPSEQLFRVEIYCTPCQREDAKVRRRVDLFRMEDGSYEGRCHDHMPKVVSDDGKESTNYEWFREHLAGTEVCFHIPWRDVEKITLHKPDPNSYDRKGDVVTVRMQDVPNKGLMRRHALEVLHGLQLMADDRATIHEWWNGTEQNYCWTDTNYHWDEHVEGTIRDKYWGDDRIKKFHKLCRLMAEIHGWEIEDETVDLLDRIAQAVEKEDN